MAWAQRTQLQRACPPATRTWTFSVTTELPLWNVEMVSPFVALLWGTLAKVLTWACFGARGCRCQGRPAPWAWHQRHQGASAEPRLRAHPALPAPAPLPSWCSWSSGTNKLEPTLKPPVGTDGLYIYDAARAVNQPGIAFVSGAQAYKRTVRPTPGRTLCGRLLRRRDWRAPTQDCPRGSPGS